MPLGGYRGENELISALTR